MGRGSSTKQKNVKKVDPTGNGAGGGTSSESQSRCLFKIQGALLVPTTHVSQIKVGDQVVLAPQQGSSSGIDVFIDGIKIGPYIGKKQRLLRSCMKERFIYSGQVIAMGGSGSNTQAEFEVSGSS